MGGVTLDAGALIAADKNDRRFWTYWRFVLARGVVPTIPAVALAQAWRGARSARLGQIVRACDVEPLDEGLAKRTGVLLGRSKARNIADAAVVAGASQRGDRILTTDPDDLAALASASGRSRVIDLRSLPAGRRRR